MDLNERIIEHLQRHYLPKRMGQRQGLSASRLAQVYADDVLRLSEHYNHDRRGITRNIFSAASMRAAYVAHYLPLNVAKTRIILDDYQSMIQPLFADQDEIRVLDLGCGPGSSLLAASDFFDRLYSQQSKKVSYVGIDRSKNFLKDLRGLFDGDPAMLTTHAIDLAAAMRLPGKRFNLIMMANFVNELDVKGIRQAARLIAKVSKTLLDKKNGILLLVEPALRETSVSLMQLKDEFRTMLKTIGPCLHQNICPLLAAKYKREWCHSERSWLKPPLINELDRRTKLDHRLLRYSYWISCHQESFQQLTKAGLCQYGDNDYRTVSNRIALSRGFKQFLCGEQGLQEVFNPPKNLKKRGDFVVWKESTKNN